MLSNDNSPVIESGNSDVDNCAGCNLLGRDGLFKTRKALSLDLGRMRCSWSWNERV
jgi:hypothetical protein